MQDRIHTLVTYLTVISGWSLGAIFAPSFVLKVARLQDTIVAFGHLFAQRLGRTSALVSLLLELLVLCLLVAPSSYTPGVVAGGVLLAVFGVGSWLVVICNKSRRAGSASIECGCMGGLGELMLTPGGSILSLIAGSAALIVGLTSTAQQGTDLAVQETVAGVAAGLAIGTVYWTAHYVFSVRVRVSAAYYEVVR